MFEDRRKPKDRRQQRLPARVPGHGCRRRSDRRRQVRAYDGKPWWLRTNYAEELDVPCLSIVVDADLDLDAES
ncbi:MAG: hypothetical protein RBS22_10210 [Spongiibacteraceae bacterium]|jgi:hypothetical protein|nr:hypothetical protein [Spongiibacteraceae bacterium]